MALDLALTLNLDLLGANFSADLRLLVDDLHAELDPFLRTACSDHRLLLARASAGKGWQVPAAGL